MSMETSYRLNVSGPAPERRVLLPELPGATAYEPGAVDRIGEQVQRAWPIAAAGGIAGGVIGSKLLRMGGGGIFRGIVGGVAGVLGGASLVLGGLALASGTGVHRAPEARPGAVTASTEVAARERVKVMTYNLHGGMGGPKEFGSSEQELDRLADVIRREQPDVLLLQEVDRFATRSNYTDVLAELDERLGADSAVSATALTQVTGRDQDVAVMTFHGFQVQDARNVVHPDPRGSSIGTRASVVWRDVRTGAGDLVGADWGAGAARNEVRNTIDAIVRTPGGTDLRVLSGHYEWPSPRVDHQGRQVGAVAGALDAWSGPTIWGADFNVAAGTAHGDAERAIMADAGLADAFGADHRGGIDRIYASEHARVIGARVVDEAGDASDHLPVVAELELEPGS